MAYFLHFYAVPETTAAPPELKAEDVPAFLRDHGTEIGDVEFAPGQCLLFLDALSAITGAPVATFQLGPFRGVFPNEQSLLFGGLTIDEGIATAQALRHFLAEPETYVPRMQEAYETLSVTPIELLDIVPKLADLIEQCLNAGGEPAAYYD